MKYFLAFVFFLFLGLMVFVAWGSRQASPVMLDEHGKPLPSADSSSHVHGGN